MAEASGLNPLQYGFESHREHGLGVGPWAFAESVLRQGSSAVGVPPARSRGATQSLGASPIGSTRNLVASAEGDAVEDVVLADDQLIRGERQAGEHCVEHQRSTADHVGTTWMHERQGTTLLYRHRRE
jgi:hypothetical protein